MKRHITVILALALFMAVLGVALNAFTGSNVQADDDDDNGGNIVVLLTGTAMGEERDIDGATMSCFDVELVDLESGKNVGRGTDCLDLNSIAPIGDDGGFEISNTTFFHLNGGTIASRSRTTVQPVGPGSTGVSHITGALPPEDTNQIIDGTGKYRDVEGRVRLSGAADLAPFFAGENMITFSCIFVIELSDKRDAEDRGPDGAVYTQSNATDGNSVLIFHRAPDGSLTPAGEEPTGGLGSGGGLGNQGAVVLSDNRRWLLAVNAGSNDLSVFRVRDSGLILTDRVPSGGTMPISVTIHDQLVYVLNDGGTANISGFRLNGQGKLMSLPESTLPLSSAMPDAAQIEFSSNGKVLVVTEKATNMISTYTVGRNGLATGPIVQPSSGATPFGFAFDRHNRMFVSEAFSGAAGASAVSSYRVDREGALSVLDGSEPTQQTAACWVAVTRDGRFAYATNTGSGTITGFAISKDGELTRLDADGVTAGQPGRAPLDAAFDRHSRFLYVLNAGTDQINGYAVQDDGSLVSLPNPMNIPDGATGLAAR